MTALASPFAPLRTLTVAQWWPEVRGLADLVESRGDACVGVICIPEFAGTKDGAYILRSRCGPARRQSQQGITWILPERASCMGLGYPLLTAQEGSFLCTGAAQVFQTYDGGGSGGDTRAAQVYCPP